ncbi:hypothetical protein ALO49_03098 [Pseudomonas savastanoi pv. retacarpa]|nr:hypothetical protein ALO49_03098 [Pseudomonas savastanoi pv. retacarpa]RML19895.1 hypothetical protein ALR00_03941 [Pseudomonas savastanoi pv. retacarpa]
MQALRTRFGKVHTMTSVPDLYQMPSEQLRTLAAQLMSKVDTQRRKIPSDETIIGKRPANTPS